MLVRTAWLAALAAAALQLPARTPDIFFVPTWQPVVYQMLELAEVTKADVVYDLGPATAASSSSRRRSTARAASVSSSIRS